MPKVFFLWEVPSETKCMMYVDVDSLVTPTQNDISSHKQKHIIKANADATCRNKCPHNYKCLHKSIGWQTKDGRKGSVQSTCSYFYTWINKFRCIFFIHTDPNAHRNLSRVSLANVAKHSSILFDGITTELFVLNHHASKHQNPEWIQPVNRMHLSKRNPCQAALRAGSTRGG